jgi:anti-sigma regulatory factor (Ser/Thr protein kinase)
MLFTDWSVHVIDPASSLASAPVASLELAPDHTAAARARHFVSKTLQHWGLEGVVADAELLVSELVTNAILHARSPATVTVDRTPTVIRVSVRDHSTATPRLRDYEPAAVTGRGLLLVDRIAQRWGIETDAGGKCVWFEVPAHADGQCTPA